MQKKNYIKSKKIRETKMNNDIMFFGSIALHWDHHTKHLAVNKNENQLSWFCW